ncbi:chemotaxis response regulator protein-glutamate methylesterase [Candidatus Scalindua japonica]|uniref:Protein-glutamate methylesterase/protein-glutamine glutaminase n=1 Tax=Candidatus Scalindua japonica TaxID=1284222 RepID=A0A286TW33_9BACT|nr:chemotaxis response regulator protein-glutamate methylesterase [Candidatus Scalindua japonica]GAX60075.1 chemotaxis response regulator protein-glutamate methylesterase [Candidatus Scalindua japonica]
MMNNKIKVLIVDDSAVVRKILSGGLSKYNDVEIVGTAPDPFIARNKIIKFKPDVLTLDVEMPKMDGITFLNKLMTHYPIPTIMVSSLTQEGCDAALKALEVGAVDFVAKPTNHLGSDVENVIDELYTKIKHASRSNVIRLNQKRILGCNGNNNRSQINRSQIHSGSRPDNGKNYTVFKGTNKVIFIGASTGGTEALKDVLIKMPPDSPAIAIVQHMPPIFTKAFAERMDSLCSITVKEGKNGDSLLPGQAIIAPGNYHMSIKRNGAMYSIATNQDAPIHHQRPAVDVLFDSASKYVGPNAIGVIMTGMGSDGATGLLKMKESGAKTIAQDEDSCVVFGMPKEAIKLGAADKVVPLHKISENILSFLKN